MSNMMMTSTKVLVVVAAATSCSIALPVTRPNNVTWSPLCRHQEADADPSSSLCSDATTNATRRPMWTYYPFPYDPTFGWYTAAVISGLMLAFLFCEGMNRSKNAIFDYFNARLSDWFFSSYNNIKFEYFAVYIHAPCCVIVLCWCFMGRPTCKILIILFMCLDGWVVGWVVIHHFQVLFHHFHVLFLLICLY